MRQNESQKQMMFDATVSPENQSQLAFPDMEWAQATYHEMADVPVVQMDALAQLQENLRLVEDMQSRLSFLMREIRYQMKF